MQGHGQGTYLEGLVVPAVGSVQTAASTMKELERPVGITELSGTWTIQAHQADAALNHVQGVPVGGVCRTGECGLSSGVPHARGSLPALTGPCSRLYCSEPLLCVVSARLMTPSNAPSFTQGMATGPDCPDEGGCFSPQSCPAPPSSAVPVASSPLCRYYHTCPY